MNERLTASAAVWIRYAGAETHLKHEGQRGPQGPGWRTTANLNGRTEFLPARPGVESVLNKVTG